MTGSSIDTGGCGQATCRVLVGEMCGAGQVDVRGWAGRDVTQSYRERGQEAECGQCGLPTFEGVCVAR